MAREGIGDKLAVYFLMTKEQAEDVNFAGGTPVDIKEDEQVISRQTWHDDTVEAYFLLEAGEERDPNYRYWNGDVNNPAEI